MRKHFRALFTAKCNQGGGEKIQAFSILCKKVPHKVPSSPLIETLAKVSTRGGTFRAHDLILDQLPTATGEMTERSYALVSEPETAGFSLTW